MTTIFLSYSTVDRKFVDKVRKDLSARNYSIWMDHCAIHGGDKWEDEIATNLANCDIFIVAVTKASNDSPWVQRETILAENLKKKRIPLLLDGEIPFRLLDVQFIDFRSNYNKGLQGLLDVLEGSGSQEEVVEEESPATFPLGFTAINFLVSRWLQKKNVSNVHKVRSPIKSKHTYKMSRKRMKKVIHGGSPTPANINPHKDPKKEPTSDMICDLQQGSSPETANKKPEKDPQEETTSEVIRELLFCVPHGWVESRIPTESELEQDKDFLYKARYELKAAAKQAERLTKAIDTFWDDLLDHVGRGGRTCQSKIRIEATGTIVLRLRINEGKEMGLDFVPSMENYKLLLDGIDSLLAALINKTPADVFLGGSWQGSVCFLLRAPQSLLDEISMSLAGHWEKPGKNNLGLGKDWTILGVYNVFSSRVSDDGIGALEKYQTEAEINPAMAEDSFSRFGNTLIGAMQGLLLAANHDKPKSEETTFTDFIACNLDDEEDITFLIPESNQSLNSFYSTGDQCWLSKSALDVASTCQLPSPTPELDPQPQGPPSWSLRSMSSSLSPHPQASSFTTNSRPGTSPPGEQNDSTSRPIQKGLLSESDEKWESFPESNCNTVRSQKQVQERFGKILKHEKVYRKTSTSFIRAAKKGEIIMEDGSMPIEVKNNTSLVVCPSQDSFSKGLYYVLSKREFLEAYDPKPLKTLWPPAAVRHERVAKKHSAMETMDATATAATTTTATGRYKSSRFRRNMNYPEEVSMALMEKGFKQYQSKRQVWGHQVTPDDIDWFRGNQQERRLLLVLGEEDEAVRLDTVVNFMAPWGEQSVQVGDYLLLQYPASNPEIYRVEQDEFLDTYEPVEELFAAAFAGCTAGDDSTFEKLVKQNKSKISDVDAHGATPLHHACSGNHVNWVSILLENGANVNAATDLGETPLYLACENGNIEIVGLLMEEGADPNATGIGIIRKTPLMLVVEQQNYNIFDYLVACGSSAGATATGGEGDTHKSSSINTLQIRTQILEGINYCHQQFKDDPIKNRKFRNAIFCTLQNQCTNDWLNSITAHRVVVFNIMLQLYCNVAWIVALMHATIVHSSSTAVSHAIVMGLVSIIFLVQEVLDAVTLKGSRYFRNPWNWFRVCANILVLVCAFVFLSNRGGGEEGDSSPVRTESFDRLIMATAFFQFAYFIAFLRNTFLPFAKFVGGTLQIIEDLLPFFITTLIILFVFAFCYYVQLFGGHAGLSLGGSFVMVFEMFVKGPADVDSLLDAVFALVMVVILLNVVIAMMTHSWEDAMSKADQLFWDFRLDFIEGLGFWETLCCRVSTSLGKKETQPREGSLLHWIDQILDRSNDGPPVGRERQSYEALPNNAQSHDISNKRRIQYFLLDTINLLLYTVKYLLFFGLGLFTFGVLWPRQIRKDILGSNKRAKKKGRMAAAMGEKLASLLQQEKALMATKVEALQQDFSDGISMLNQENKHLKDDVATMKLELAEMKEMMKQERAEMKEMMKSLLVSVERTNEEGAKKASPQG